MKEISNSDGIAMRTVEPSDLDLVERAMDLKVPLYPKDISILISEAQRVRKGRRWPL